MAKFQIAFCLLVALTVMLQVEAGYINPLRNMDDMAVMRDLMDSSDTAAMKNLMSSSDMAVLRDLMDSSELTKRSCYDMPRFASVCRSFNSVCDDKHFFASERNYAVFAGEWCKATCNKC